MITVNSPQSEQSKTNAHSLSTRLWLVLLTVAFVAGLGAGYFAWGANTPALAAVLPTDQPQRLNVPTDGDPAFGPANAPVTIIEFSDYECSFCRKWHIEAWQQIQQAYAGKVRLVYRDFPLYGAHPNAEPAAEAANCAGEQGQYWPYHEKLFGGAPLNANSYITLATDLKLDMAKFKNCLESHRTLEEVQSDAKYGASLGIQGTPTFFINGIPLVGAQPFSAFKKIIDQELAASK